MINVYLVLYMFTLINNKERTSNTTNSLIRHGLMPFLLIVSLIHIVYFNIRKLLHGCWALAVGLGACRVGWVHVEDASQSLKPEPNNGN